jgi:leucyl/phenylalanyl-tRNA--protein transferase
VLFGLRRVSKFEWRSYENRAVITADSAKVPKRVQQVRRKLDLEVRFGEDHDAIIERCQEGRDGWLTSEVADVYRELDGLGCLATVGAYQDGLLVGGLWGPAIGGTFGIMSMFHTVDHAGAVALAALSDAVGEGEWAMADCGLLNENFRRYGAYEVPTSEFCELVWRGVSAPRPRRGRGDATPRPAR